MQGLSVGFWRWFQAKMAAVKGQTPNRLRRQRTSSVSTFAAEVEKLESRELLTVTFQGGAVITNVAVQNVYLGSDWTGKALQNQAAQLDKFDSTLVQSSFMDGMTLAGYNVYRGSTSPSVVDKIALDKTLLSTDGSNGGFGGITDAQIQGYIQGLINTGKVQPPNANRLYMIYVEPGVVVSLAPGENNVFGIEGYHGSFIGQTASGASQDIRYAVIMGSGYPTLSAFGPPWTLGLPTGFNQLTIVTSHELAEAMTDPDVALANNTGNASLLGWIDINTGEEVGDIVQNNLMIFRQYEIQAISTLDENPISFNAVTQKLTAPQNLVLTAGPTSTTGELSWSASPLAQAYRIFSINGSQRTFLGRTDAFTTTFQLTGLKQGQRVSLLVEAFNGSSAVDSTIITGTAPFAQGGAQGNAALRLAAADKASAPHAPVVNHASHVVMPDQVFMYAGLSAADTTDSKRNHRRVWGRG